MTKFLIVNILFAYNAIIGYPTLNHLCMIVLTYYVTLKFSISAGVAELKSD